jgi:hypothetical protein
MAVTPYNRITNLQNDQALNPTDPYPAPGMDAEYNALKITTDDLIQHLELIQDADGTLANGVVGRDQIDPYLLAGFTQPTPWVTGNAYLVANTVFHANSMYYCNNDHTSGVFAADFDAGHWTLLVNLDQSTGDAQVAAAAANASATSASNSATSAATSASNASTSATNAAASAAAAITPNAFPWDYRNVTTMADPGFASMRFNNSSYPSVTQIVVSANCAIPVGAPDVSDWVVTWDDSTNPVKGHITIRKNVAPAAFVIFRVTGAVTDFGSYLQIPVSYVTHNPTGLFSNGDRTNFEFSRAGDAGTTTVVGGIPEAPSDGSTYGRRNAAWNLVAAANAAAVPVTPAGNISSSNVQAALQELDGEKVAKAGDTMTGMLQINYPVGDQTSLINFTDGTHYEIVTWQDASGYVEFDMDGFGPGGAGPGNSYSYSRGSSSAYAGVNIGDEVGWNYYYFYDGGSPTGNANGWRNSASLGAVVDGAPVPGVGTPTALSFRTGAAGLAGVERLRIRSDGEVLRVADPVAALGVATKQYVDAHTSPTPSNLIINGDFRVNQTFYVSGAVLAAGSYGHDQWKAGASGGDYIFTQLKSSTQITIGSGKSLIQPIEDVNVAGGSYVLSWTGTAQARAGVNTLTPSGGYLPSPLLITGQTAGTNMSVEFNNGTLGKVKLEAGTGASPFVMKPFQDELLLCQRYWHCSNPDSIIGVLSPAPFPQVKMVATVSYGVTGSVTFPVMMRADPSIRVWCNAVENQTSGTGPSGPLQSLTGPLQFIKCRRSISAMTVFNFPWTPGNWYSFDYWADARL